MTPFGIYLLCIAILSLTTVNAAFARPNTFRIQSIA
jgi:hypothetical protein